MGVLARVVLVVALVAGLTGEALARRVALVIGNADYRVAGQLANPVNDAADLARKLRAIGFEVIDGYDLGKRGMEQRIGDFADALHEAETGLFFYAGHGIQVDGRNYILPVDARLDIPAKLRLEAVQVDDVLDLMGQQVATSIVFLDACRNNPFARSLAGKAKTRGVQVAEGLAQIDTMRGSFIAFSTAPGSVAMDGTGRNSPFATALLHHIATPGQSINDMMIEVRREVLKETRDQQTPMSWDSLTARFAFVPDGAAPVDAAPAAEPAVAPEDEVIEANAPANKTVPVIVAKQPPKDKAKTQKVVVAKPTKPVDPDTVHLADEVRSSVETFLRTAYLAPKPDSIVEDVDRMYMDQVVSYGVVYSKDRLTRVKRNWFKKYKSSKMSLVPGSLTIDSADGGRVHATFFIDYVYERRTAKPLTGRAGVKLELVPAGDSWRIASEQKFP